MNLFLLKDIAFLNHILKLKSIFIFINCLDR